MLVFEEQLFCKNNNCNILDIISILQICCEVILHCIHNWDLLCYLDKGTQNFETLWKLKTP